jgi:hypothetical protein
MADNYNARTTSFAFNDGPSSSNGNGGDQYFHSSSTPADTNSSGSSANSFANAGNNSSSSFSTAGSGGSGGGGSGGKEEALHFDVMSWYPKYQSCQRYFLEVAQHSYPCQALAAFINIKLPFQRAPVMQGAVPIQPHMPSSSRPPQYRNTGGFPIHPTISQFGWVSLHPYMRRLVATGFDVAAILHGWFGDDWEDGVGPLHEQERRNYMFAAKSGGWKSVKKQYDEVIDEAVPYLIPLSKVQNAEIEGAESLWSRWLAMEDWMLGARAPAGDMGDEH